MGKVDSTAVEGEVDIYPDLLTQNKLLKAEIQNLKHDLESYMDATMEYANENERLKTAIRVMNDAMSDGEGIRLNHYLDDGNSTQEQQDFCEALLSGLYADPDENDLED